MAQPDHRVRRGGARPAPRQPGQLADPPEGAAGRPRRGARCGRLGPAGARQPAHRLRRRRPRPGRARPAPRRADRPGPVRRPLARRGGARPRDPRPDRRDGRARRREAAGAPGGRHCRRRRACSRCSATSAASEPKAGLTDPDEVPEPPEEPYVKPGELWRVGDHRILCGDATNGDDVARLIDGAAPTLIVTDPPYGVQLDQTWRDGVYNGPRKRVKGWGVVAGAKKPYMMREVPDAEEAPTGQARASHRGPPQHARQHGHPRPSRSEASALVPVARRSTTSGTRVAARSRSFGPCDQRLRARRPDHLGEGCSSRRRQQVSPAARAVRLVRRPGVPIVFVGEARPSTIWRAHEP